MCAQVWDNPRVHEADEKFNEVLERVRGETLRAELLAAFESGVSAAATARS